MDSRSDAIDAVRDAYAARAAADAGDVTRLLDATIGVEPARSLTEVLTEDRLILIVEPRDSLPWNTPRAEHVEPADIEPLAQTSEAHGACALGIVTDPLVRAGRAPLMRARAATRLPLIARELIVDARQAIELRALGADAVIVPGDVHVDDEATVDLTDPSEARSDVLASIIDVAHQLGMEVGVSVRNEAELARAISSDADFIDLDNRRRDGAIDAERTLELLADVPVGWPVISEAPASIDQLRRLHRAGVDAIIIDETHGANGIAATLDAYADLSFDV